MVQFLLALHAPDRYNALLLRHPCRCREAVANETSCHALHRDESHVFLAALPDQLQLLLSGKIAERELQRLIKSGVNRLVRHGKAVVRDGNVADFALFFCLQRRVIESVVSARLRTERRIVELVNVDVVGLQRAKAGL